MSQMIVSSQDMKLSMFSPFCFLKLDFSFGNGKLVFVSFSLLPNGLYHWLNKNNGKSWSGQR